ncbi:MAG: glutaredoxin [Gammaproteobacteria bacterium]|nr:glutaredoxin [Gammaproteobacteria bacterium]
MSTAALKQTPGHTLYYSQLCGFCSRVLQVARSMGLELELRDVDFEAGRRQELIVGGGKGQVPCLRIEGADGSVNWMYESADISHYLKEHFSS